MIGFPHFLNLLPAAIAAALTIPALLLLYFLKLRRREFSVPSTLLWRKAVQDMQVNSPFQRLRRNLLLLLQLLLLLALLLALARPVQNAAPGAGGRSILLIDRSASMQADDGPNHSTRLDEAKRRAKDLVASMTNNAAAMVIAFDESAQTVCPFTSDQRVLNAAIDAIQPTDRLTRLHAAYQLADAQAVFSGGENQQFRPAPDVYLFSDGRADDVEKVSVRGNLHFDPIGAPSTGNVAIVALSARRDYQQLLQVQVFARLANFGPDPISNVQLQLSVDGQIRSTGSVSLLPESFTDDQRRAAIAAGFSPTEPGVAFPPLEMNTAGIVKVEQLLRDNDHLSSDDSASVVVPAPKMLQVLLVTPSNWFLEKGLQSLKLQTLDIISEDEFHSLPDQRGGGKSLPLPYDIIIFDRTHLTEKEIPVSGSAIYFGCIPPGLTVKPALDDANNPVTCDDNGVLDWQRDHPILRHLNLGKLYIAHATRLLPSLDSQVLVDGTNCPLIVLHREKRALHLILPFDLVESSFPLQPTFPVFLYQTMQYLALGSDMAIRPSYQPGVALRIPRFNLEKLGKSLDSILLKGPAGDVRVKIPDKGDFVLPPLDRVGVYTTDPAIPQYEKIAVNLTDDDESNLLPRQISGGTGSSQSQTSSIPARVEWWWWLIAAGALPLLMIEWWVYTRRLHA